MSTPTHWARVQVVQGVSPAATWDLSSQLPEARVTVGSGAQAGWNVKADGVEAVHFELYWDGKSLWVGPPMAGTLTVDGERVQAWRQLTGRCRVEFGRAAMTVESSQSIGVAGGVIASTTDTDFSDDGATAIFQGEIPGVTSDAGFPSAGVPSAGAPSAGAPSAGMPSAGAPSAGAPSAGMPSAGFPSAGTAPAPSASPLEPAATRMLDPGAAAASIPRPGLGGSTGDAPRAAAPTVGMPMPSGPQFGDSTSAPAPEFKTQILDTEALGIRPSAPPPAPAPAAGPPPAAPRPGVGGGGGTDARPTLMASQLSTDVLSMDKESTGTRETTGPGGTKFALPPIEDGTEKKPGKLQLPPKRTLILLGVTLVVAIAGVVLISLRESAAQDAANAAAAAQQANQAQEARARADQLRERIQADRSRIRQDEAAAVSDLEASINVAIDRPRSEAIAALGDEATEEQRQAAGAEATRLAVEKLAVDSMMSNELRQSLGYYLYLQREFPNETYSGVIAVLRAKLECRRGVRRNGTPCG